MIIINGENFITIKAEEGFVLNREDIFTSEPVMLGCNDSIDNWKELTEEESLMLQKEMEQMELDESLLLS